MDLNLQAKNSGVGSSNTREDNKRSDVGVGENSDHTLTTQEPPSCRACFDEEEDNNAINLMELRCSCQGHMSRMHRNCIIMWYGPRMIVDKHFKCELCKTILHPATRQVVEQAVTDSENHGRDILLKALAAKLGTWHHVDLESAATYRQLFSLVRNTDSRRSMLLFLGVNARTRHPCLRVAGVVAGVVVFVVSVVSVLLDRYILDGRE